MFVKVVTVVKFVGIIPFVVQFSIVSGTVPEGGCSGRKNIAEKLTHMPNIDAKTCPTNAP